MNAYPDKGVKPTQNPFLMLMSSKPADQVFVALASKWKWGCIIVDQGTGTNEEVCSCFSRAEVVQPVRAWLPAIPKHFMCLSPETSKEDLPILRSHRLSKSVVSGDEGLENVTIGPSRVVPTSMSPIYLCCIVESSPLPKRSVM
jgi:hypothetical protein